MQKVIAVYLAIFNRCVLKVVAYKRTELFLFIHKRILFEKSTFIWFDAGENSKRKVKIEESSDDSDNGKNTANEMK